MSFAKKYITGALTLLLALCLLPLGDPGLGETTQVLVETPQGIPWLVFEAAPGVSYARMDGNQRTHPPEGLEALYQWMETGNPDADKWMVCMPNSRVVIGLSRSEIGQAYTPQELTSFWPAMVYHLQQGALYVEEEGEHLGQTQLDGQVWLAIHTTAVLDGERMLSVQLEGYANCDAGTMLEIWIAAPAQPTYLYDDIAYGQLEADSAAAEQWLQSVRFLENAAPEGDQ